MATSLLIAHAGSLNSLLQNELIPVFGAAAGYGVEQRRGPAVGLANQILNHEIAADLYMSADAESNALLMGGSGPASEEACVRWFIAFARTRIVLAYGPQSRFRADFEAAAAGKKAWYEVLQQPGPVLKRHDPRVDPGGYRTVFLMQLAEHYYGVPGLKDRILQGDDNVAQLVPGVPANLRDGSVDAMFMYVTGAHDGSLPYIQLPDEIDLSNPAFAASYRRASYTNPLGQTLYGTPAYYSVTIPTSAPNPEGAVAFIAYLLSPQGKEAVLRRGFTAATALVGGDAAAVPVPLQAMLDGPYITG